MTKRMPQEGAGGRFEDSDTDVDVDGDHDPSTITASLLSGRSVIVGGPLGCGKSHLLGRVLDQLRARGADPLVIRGAVALQRTALGALNANPDPRARGLDRVDVDDAQNALLVVVDDAQLLDAASLASVLHAMHARGVASLIAVTEPRLSSGVRDDIVDVIHEVWLAGHADRIELQRLSTRESEQLLDRFAPDDPFDSATRAALVWAADGSRMLLRALADAARSAVSAGRDPLTVVTEAPTHGTLAAVAAAHVRELSDEQTEALVLLQHAHGLRYADAARFIPTSVIDDLRATGLVHDDNSTGHHLSVNRFLANAAERVWGRERSRRALDCVLDRMIRDRGRWWSVPLARQLAERWLREVAHPSQLVDVPTDLMERVILDAAREANDRGEPAHATAYTAWLGDDFGEAAVAVERLFAQSLLGTELPSTAALSLDDGARRRARSLAQLLAIRDRSALEEWAGVVGLGNDEACEWERAIERAHRALGDLRLRDAVVLAEHIRRHPDIQQVGDRIGAELLDSMARAYLGESQAMITALRRASRLFRSGGRFGDALDRLAARSFHLACHTVAGTDDAEAVAQLTAERDSAVRTGGAGIAAASFATVFVETRRGRMREARRELRAGRARAAFAGGEAVGMIELETAYGLAVFGQPDEAATVLASVELSADATTMFQHSRAATESVVAAAGGRRDDALTHASDAWGYSSETDAVMLQLRDLHRLIVLGHDAAQEYAVLMSELAHGVEAETAQVLLAGAHVAAAEQLQTEWDGDRALAQLRAALVPIGRAAGTPSSARGHASAAGADLTAREVEIARLIRQGMSNRRIAETLFLSVRTVESHIYQARAKVGAPTRGDLGAAVPDESERRPRSARAR